MRIPAVLSCLVAVVVAACSDPSGPSAAVGHYELVAVNGQPIPYVAPPSTGYSLAPLYIGDLLLRGDGTYGLAIGFYSAGTWTSDGTRVHLAAPDARGGSGLDAIVDGDSAVIDIAGASSGLVGTAPSSMHYLFRRSSAASPVVTSGAYTLATVNGRGEPLTLYDTTIYGVRSVAHVGFDSVTFMDGVFYRQHRTEVDSSSGMESRLEYTNYGSYRGRGDSLFLHSSGWASPPDGLVVEQQQLVRRTPYFYGTVEERYTRR